MKQEIEFRGRTAKGEWVYGYHAKFRNYKNEVYSAIIPKDEETGEAYMEDLHSVIHETVGQYVGITDSNGKKVYVGDIIKARHNFYPYKVFVRECKVCIEDEAGNAIRPTNEALKHFDSEVIGNIFEKED